VIKNYQKRHEYTKIWCKVDPTIHVQIIKFVV